MRKIITGASIILILVSIYGLQKTVFDSHRVKSRTNTAVAATPTPGPDLLVVSTTLSPDPTPQITTTPAPVPKSTPAPLTTRVVKHQPDQFRKGALSKEELFAINKAIETIPWSRNANPKEAAKEDYAAIVKECEKSGVHGLFTDLITEAISNDYQTNDEAANGAYASQLNSDFQNSDQSDSSNGKSTDEKTAEQLASVDTLLIPTVRQPEVAANGTTTSSPAVSQPEVTANGTTTSTPPVSQPEVATNEPATSLSQQPASGGVIHPKSGHVRHRSVVRRKIVDVKKRLIELWHQSLVETEKSPK